VIIKCKEDLAGDRIKVLLAREREGRESDGLDVPPIRDTCSSGSDSGGSVSDDGCWADESSLSGTESVASRDTGASLSAEKPPGCERWTRVLGIDDEFRKEVVGWMLDARLDFVLYEMPC
jgi:hypothetical protein